MKRILLMACFAGLMSTSSFAAEKEAQPLSPETVQGTKVLLTAATLRDLAARKSESAVKALFSSRGELRWQRVTSEFSEEQLNDFFLGSIIMGSKNPDYSALYNPFWDTLLLLNSTGLPDVPKVDRFAFVSGHKFRGEPYAMNPEAVEGTVPDANPYAVDLWNVCSRTKKHYETLYAPKAASELSRFMVTDLKDIEQIQIRSAIRLRLLLKFMKNKPMQREAQRISRYLTAGNEEKMKKYFKDGGANFIPQFVRLNPLLRQKYIPYCYFPGKDATLFVFFNSELPRIIATVTIPSKSFTRIFEWYDLMASEELLTAWNSVKEVKEEKENK
ncbi:MAG: hypothetical protein IJJ26_06640 [Victivallales bacterium]|nr:hypothetical protein [Victivallales bacterium]